MISAAVCLSPSKTQKVPQGIAHSQQSLTPRFMKEAEKIAGIMKERTPEYFTYGSKIGQHKAEEIHTLWQSWGKREAPCLPAARLYKGPAFSALNDRQPEGISRLFILSALYGILEQNSCIQPYRLDFTHRDVRPEKKSLLEFWRLRIDAYFKGMRDAGSVNYIIDLCSSEFSRVIPADLLPVTRVDFRQWKQGRWKAVSATSKQLRGHMAAWILSRKVLSPEDLKYAEVEGYGYNNELSKENTLIFTPVEDRGLMIEDNPEIILEQVESALGRPDSALG